MTTAATAPVEQTHDTNGDEAPQWFRLRGIDWETYRAISDALTGRHVRLTYDRGTLEFMTISFAHGTLGRLMVLFVAVLAEELNMTMRAGGDMTLDREDLERGIEPDEVFYLANEPLVRGKATIDLSTDPPPDLGVEVEVTRSSRRRMPIYQAIGVPEVWRVGTAAVTIHVRGPDGQYVVAERSQVFPFVSGADLFRFLEMHKQMDEVALVRSFRAWVREQIAGGARP